MQLLTQEDLDKFRQLIDLEIDDRTYRAQYGDDEDHDILEAVAGFAIGLVARLEATKEYLSRIEFATKEEIGAARDTHYSEDGDFAVDDDALVSRCRNGECWVSAWVKIGGER